MHHGHQPVVLAPRSGRDTLLVLFAPERRTAHVMTPSPTRDALPIVDIASASRSDADFDRMSASLDRACCEFGFFYVTGHGVDPGVGAAMESSPTSAGNICAEPLGVGVPGHSLRRHGRMITALRFPHARTI